MNESSEEIDNLEDIRNNVIEESVKKAFSPEFLNRLDDIIIFKALTKEDIKNDFYYEYFNQEGEKIIPGQNHW